MISVPDGVWQHAVGQGAALLTAVAWGYAVVLFKLSGERVPPVSLSLFKNTLGLGLLLATLGILSLADAGQIKALLHEHPGDVCLLVLSGVVGIAIADTIFFYALNRIGVGLIAVVDCSYSPMVMVLSWLLLCEKLTWLHYAGGGLIVVGVFVATRHKLPEGRTRAEIVGGMALTVLAIAMMATGIVIAKPIVEGIPLILATTVRMTGGAVFLALFALLGRRWRSHWTIFRPSSAWKTAFPAAFLGTYLCMILWVAGFKYTHASVAAVLNQTSVIFQVVFAALILKEYFGPRKIVALVLAMTGVAIVLAARPLLAWAGSLGS
jgi:drug/metabolite transporter (DMT)-like permease